MMSFSSLQNSFSSSYKPNSEQSVSLEDLQRTLDGDRWKTYFQQAHKNLTSSSKFSRTSSAAISPLAPLRNIIDIRGTRLYFWDQDRNAVVLTNIQDAELNRVTILECDISPLFEVTSITVSPNGSSVALIGPKGVSILDVGPEDSIPESGRKIARCIAISERFFLNNPKLSVCQCEWFPFRETHIVLLTSDSQLRFYRISSPSQASLIVSLHGSGVKRSLHSFSAFTLVQTSSTMSASSIDSPQKGSSAASVYALKSDGNVWTFDVTVGSERTVGSSLRGPLLANAPFAADMSQMATSILFIDATLPVLLIASNRQRILHGVLIEKDDIEVDYEIHISGVIPSKYEFLEIERLELTSSSAESGSGSKTTATAKLLSCPNFSSCYVYATDRQLLGVKLPWLEDLDLLVSDSLDLSSIRPSAVQTVLSLDPSAETDAVSLLGGRLISTDLGECSVLSVASNGQISLQKLLQSSATQKLGLADLSHSFNASRDLSRRHKPSNEVPFDEYIESLLRRDRSVPTFTYNNPDQFSADELLRMAAQGVQVFQDQYVLKQKQAYEEIQNRKTRNDLRKRELLEMVTAMEERLLDLNAQFQQYSSQSDNTDQEALETHSRISNLQEEFFKFNPVLSEAEKQLEENLENFERRSASVEELIERITGKMNYREHILHQNESAPVAAATGDNMASQVAVELGRLDGLKKSVKELTDKLHS